MSRVLHIDPVGGIAGDMLCAALIDLGADVDVIQAALTQLGVPEVLVSVERVQRGAFSALQFKVHCEAEHHPHRTHANIRALISDSGLSERVRVRALAVFQAIAAAEAHVHGVAIEAVHFHEVGAWDSIADIVGAAVALEQLGVDTLISGPPPLSTGTIQTAHGHMPLPAPATLQLLAGWPVRPGPQGRECTTPTGAGILAALATAGSLPAMRLIGTGIGAGSRDPEDAPNVLRATLGTAATAASPGAVNILEAQMDDLSGEHLPPLIAALFSAGALDAYATPILMKKGRAGLLLTALATPETTDLVTAAMLKHGSTFGVRRSSAQRTVLDRWHDSVDTPWGPIRVKVGATDGDILHASPEYEDVAALALASGQTAPTVHAAALQAWRNANEG
jgi:uncharacterized protein (TIGR00299 family) protein